MKCESYALRMNYGKIPHPLPEDIRYWRAYLEGLEYCYKIFKDDNYNQVQMFK